MWKDDVAIVVCIVYHIILFVREIKGTKVIAKIKRVQSRDKDKTWKTGTLAKNTK